MRIVLVGISKRTLVREGFMNQRVALSVLVVAALVATSVVAGTVEDNKELVAKFIEATNAQDYDNLPNYITEDFMRHSQASPDVVITNKEQFKLHMRDGLDVFPDARLDVKQIISEGDRVALWASYLGTYKGKFSGGEWLGPKLDVDIGAIFRVEGDKIAEMWMTWDNQAIQSQLDAQKHFETR